MGKKFEDSYIKNTYYIKPKVMKSAPHFLKVIHDKFQFDDDDNADDKED